MAGHSAKELGGYPGLVSEVVGAVVGVVPAAVIVETVVEALAEIAPYLEVKKNQFALPFSETAPS